MTSELWDGMFLRGDLGETGTVPRNSTSSQSADLIAYGTEPMPNPSLLEDASVYSTNYSNQIYLNEYNYMYMRAKNLHSGPVSGHFEFYYSQSNLLLLPAYWQQLATSDGNTKPPFAVELQNQIAATTNPFSWLVKPPDQGHYCTIGIVVSDLHGSPVVMTDRITDWTGILASNGNIAQRNMHLITGEAPDIADQVPFNIGIEGATIDLVFILNNIPLGSEFRATSGTPLHGKPITVTNLDTKETSFKQGPTDLDVPANWSTLFGWTLKFGNDWADITGTPSVQVRGELVQNSSDPLYHLGRVAGRHPETGQLRVDQNGDLVKLVTFGTFKSVAIDKRNPALA